MKFTVLITRSEMSYCCIRKGLVALRDRGGIFMRSGGYQEAVAALLAEKRSAAAVFVQMQNKLHERGGAFHRQRGRVMAMLLAAKMWSAGGWRSARSTEKARFAIHGARHYLAFAPVRSSPSARRRRYMVVLRASANLTNAPWPSNIARLGK